MYTPGKIYNDFKNELMKDFNLSSSADADVFLEITIERLSGGAIKIVQRRYVDDIVAVLISGQR